MLSKEHHVSFFPSSIRLPGLTSCPSVNFGRVPVRTVFEDALQCLTENQEKMQSYITHELPLDDAAKGYDIFEQRKARKVILNISK